MSEKRGRARRFGRAAVAVAVIVATVSVAGPAGGQANDDRANATVVTEPLPFSDSVDTTGATGEADDPGCISAPGDPGNPTVWYSYTPSFDGFVQANTFGSDYDTALGAYVDDGVGGLTELACNDDYFGLQSRVDVAATAGQTILFMVGAFAGQPGGGQLVFGVDLGQEPLMASATVDTDASVSSRDGTITVRGTAECSRAATVDLFVQVRQLRAGAVVQGFDGSSAACNGTVEWEADIDPELGRFTGGSAMVTVDGFVYDGANFVSIDPIKADVKLRGTRPGGGTVRVTPDLVYGEADGQTLMLDLYEPASGPKQNRPAVIYAHGGGFVSGSRTGFLAVSYATDLATQGVVAASMSYRLNGLNLPAMIDAQHDMQAAVRWMRDNARSLGVDPDRIYVMGHSAGAITALHTNFNSEDPGSSGTPGVSSEVAGAISLAGFAFPPFIDPGEPPILMYHGTADTTVPFPWGEATCTTTVALGNSCDLEVLDGVGHSVESVHDQIVGATVAFVGGG